MVTHLGRLQWALEARLHAAHSSALLRGLTTSPYTPLPRSAWNIAQISQNMKSAVLTMVSCTVQRREVYSRYWAHGLRLERGKCSEQCLIIGGCSLRGDRVSLSSSAYSITCLVFFKVFCLFEWQVFLGWGQVPSSGWHKVGGPYGICHLPQGTQSLIGKENLLFVYIYMWYMCVYVRT